MEKQLYDAFTSLDSFFNSSEALDFQHVRSLEASTLLADLQCFDNVGKTLNTLLGLQQSLFIKDGIRRLVKAKVRQLLELQVFKILSGHLKLFLNRIRKTGSGMNASKEEQNLLRVLINLLWIMAHQAQQEEVQNTTIKEQLIEMIQLSLQFSFIPIKKVCLLLGLVLHRVFNQQNADEQSFQNFRKFTITDLTLKNCIVKKVQRNSRVEAFYFDSVDRLSEGKLAQIIVVGLLRALLSICPQQKQQTVGVDSSRQFRSPLELWDQKAAAQASMAENIQRHNYKVAGSILALMTFLAGTFFKCKQLQATYFIELITQANGVLVLLKFISEKFNNIQKKTGAFSGSEETVQQVLTKPVLFCTYLLCSICLNSSQRVSNFLFKYNTFLMLHRLQQNFNHALIDRNCTDLIKVQIPHFNQKMKDFAKAMKIASDVYCRAPLKVLPKTLNTSEKLAALLKLKIKKEGIPLQEGEIKSVHMQFNSSKYLRGQSRHRDQTELENKSPSKEELRIWLEENVYNYLD